MGGDVISTEEFEVNEDSDVIFIILQEGTYTVLDEPTCNHSSRCWSSNLVYAAYF